MDLISNQFIKILMGLLSYFENQEVDLMGSLWGWKCLVFGENTRKLEIFGEHGYVH